MQQYIMAVLATSLCAARAGAEVPVVVTDIAPVHAMVAMVMGDLGQPVLLLDRGGDAHDFQLRPSQARAVAEADAVIWTGPGMSPWLTDALAGNAAAGVSLPLMAVPGTRLRSYAEAEDGHAAGEAAEAGDDHGHDHADGHGDEGHDDHAGHAHQGTDPHAWLDPGNAALWVGAITAELARQDPAHASAYQANADAAVARIAAAEAAADALLAPVADRPFVVTHDAYGYFAERFGLTVAGAVSGGDAAAPGAGRLRALYADAAAGGVACVFPEANHDPEPAAQLAAATGARLGRALDPEGSAMAPGPDLYIDLITGMAETIADCLAPR